MKLFVAFLAASIVIAGCKSGPSLDGKWNMSGGNMGNVPPGSTMTMSFSGNNVTFDMHMKDPQMGELGVTANGTYTLDKDKFKMTMTDVKADTSKVSAQAKPIVDQLFKPETLKDQMNKDNEFTAKFVTDTEVTLAGKNGTITLKKI